MTEQLTTIILTQIAYWAVVQWRH